ncbi:MAG: NYN domain-containing protein [Pirellulales bacterium]
MTLLIDGYNLLHASGIFGRGVGPGTLRRARHALVRFLIASLTDKERERCVVVFDAREAPPGLPRTESFEGITVRYADRQSDADSLLEELIQQDSAPRRMVVVSSDHRVQRAARRRRAQAVDSEVWFAELVRRRVQTETSAPAPAKPHAPLGAGEIAYWLERFSTAEEHAEAEHEASEEAAGQPPPWNPFPPGYAEDVTDQ